MPPTGEPTGPVVQKAATEGQRSPHTEDTVHPSHGGACGAVRWPCAGASWATRGLVLREPVPSTASERCMGEASQDGVCLPKASGRGGISPCPHCSGVSTRRPGSVGRTTVHAMPTRLQHRAISPLGHPGPSAAALELLRRPGRWGAGLPSVPSLWSLWSLWTPQPKALGPELPRS